MRGLHEPAPASFTSRRRPLVLCVRATAERLYDMEGSHTMWRRIFALAFAIGLALLGFSTAEAHANLVRSDPPAGALLAAAPKEVVLEFSEELDPSFSRVQLFNSNNQLVDAGPGVIDPVEPRVLHLALGKLPNDSYTAIWRVRSAVDGHVSRGSVPFGVGVAVTTTSLIPPPGAPDPATPPPPLLDAAVRWLNLLMAAVALGALPFGLFVWRPAWRARLGNDRRPMTDDRRQAADDRPWTVDGGQRMDEGGQQENKERALVSIRRSAGSPVSHADGPSVAAALRRSFLGSAQDRLIAVRQEPGAVADSLQLADEQMLRVSRRLLLIGGGLFVLTNLAFLVVQAAAAADVPIVQAIGTPIVQLINGRSGLLWLARIALLLLIGGLAWRLPPAGRGSVWPWWAALVPAGGVLLTFSLNSHGAAMGHDVALTVALDWLHLVAAVAWLGGLVPLGFAIHAAWRTPERSLPLVRLIPRFSVMAVGCVTILVFTGVYSFVLHVGGLGLLIATTYGRALLVKVVVFGVLLVVAGLNLFVLAPRLSVGDGHAATISGRSLVRTFGRTVRTELLLGALILLAVGVMTSVAPGKIAWEEHERQGIVQTAEVDDVRMVLRIAPGQIGDNEFAVDVLDPRPGAQDVPAEVLLRFGMLGMEMGDLQAVARPSAAGPGGEQRYTARGSFVSMGGRWQITVVLRRAGFNDVRHTFEADVLRAADEPEGEVSAQAGAWRIRPLSGRARSPV